MCVLAVQNERAVQRLRPTPTLFASQPPCVGEREEQGARGGSVLTKLLIKPARFAPRTTVEWVRWER